LIVKQCLLNALLRLLWQKNKVTICKLHIQNAFTYQSKRAIKFNRVSTAYETLMLRRLRSTRHTVNSQFYTCVELTHLQKSQGVSLKHDRTDGTVKMANLPVPSVCEIVTDGTDCPVCRLSVTTGRRLLKHDGKMAHLTGQNGPSDVTGKRLLKHDWTDWTAKMVHHCVPEVK